MGETNTTATYLSAICDYRANYLGCGQHLKQAFATIDIIMIFLATLSILIYSGKIAQNFISKVVKEKENKKKWNAIDTTCLLCCLSNVFRIAQLANVRSVAYQDTSAMTGYQMRQYLQVNIVMDFIYYGTGVAASSVFVSSVVSATAGVSLYSDIKIGSTTISPDRILRVFRLVVLILTLTFNICWATIGTTSGIEYYLLYRRAGYVLSITTIALVTLPVMVFFSNKVLEVIMNSSSHTNSHKDKSHEAQNSVANRTVENSHVESKPKSEVDSKSPSIASKISRTVTIAKKSTVGRKESRIANFKLAINMVIYLLYVMTMCNLSLLIIGYELSYFQENNTAILILKSISDFSVWISCSFMAIYLYRAS
ncbi:hypothetical protein HDV06_005360 [Boothiomyces sp. JEL0866]|nr:hypothetical protein HDV06_005360 [Boothiomyces sp. JEL0866]